MPLVSVIVPIYNVELYIEKCARSLFEQTLQDIEIIFIDDCTPDNSIKIIENTILEYTGISNKVQIVKLPENSGVATARRLGIAMSKGEYIAFCDSDDWVDVDMYRELYSKAEENDADCVLCDYYESDGDNVQPIIYAYCNKEVLMSDLLSYKKGGSMCFQIAKRELYENIIFPKKHMWEDLVISIQVFYYAKNIVQYSGRPLYYYYQNPKSVSYKPSFEACFSRMNNSGENIKLIEKFLDNKQLLSCFSDELVLLKYYSLFFIAEYTFDKKIRSLWRNTYPNVVGGILKSSRFPIDIRIKTLLLNTGLFPLIKRMFKYFK